MLTEKNNSHILLQKSREVWDMGVIRTYQKCPKCGAGFPSSKGRDPIECRNGCMTRPTKYFIKIHCRATKKDEAIYCDRMGKPMCDFNHAAAVMGEIRAEIDRTNGAWDPNIYKKQSKTAFAALWGKFQYKYRERSGTRDKIKAIYKHHLQQFVSFQMRDITTIMIDDWWEALRDKTISAHYKNDILQWLHTFFDYALSLDIIERLPHFPKPEDLPEPQVEDWLSIDEQIRILEEMPAHDRPIYDFLFLTGVRIGEAIVLQRTDIQWNKGVVIITNTIKRDGSIGIVKNKKRRTIPLVADIEACLRQAVKISGLGKWVFVNKRGRHYTDDYLRDLMDKVAIKTIGRRIKLKNSSRHSIGNQLAGRGYSMEQIRDLLNHSNTRVTRHYVEIQAKHLESMYGRPNPDKIRTNSIFDGKVIN
jgi:site-specific recombinase XerD